MLSSSMVCSIMGYIWLHLNLRPYYCPPPTPPSTFAKQSLRLRRFFRPFENSLLVCKLLIWPTHKYGDFNLTVSSRCPRLCVSSAKKANQWSVGQRAIRKNVFHLQSCLWESDGADSRRG